MATKWHNVEGFIKWTHVYEPDEFGGSKRWITNFYPKDEENRKKIEDTKVELKWRTDGDGDYVKFRRDAKKLIKDELVMFAPPKLTGVVNVTYRDQDGNEIRSVVKGDGKTINRDGDEVTLWNYTKVVLNFQTYDTAKGVGHRWESMRVLELGPEYEKIDQEDIEAAQEEKPKEEKKMVKKEAAKGEVLSTSDVKTSLSKDMDDDIPW